MDEAKAYLQLLDRAIIFYSQHYKDYLDVISYPEKVLEILDLADRFRFSVGSYRPDFMVDREGRLKLIEVTARYAFTGFYYSFLSQKYAHDKLTPEQAMRAPKYYEPYFEQLERRYPPGEPIVVFDSNDHLQDLKFYRKMFELAGCEVVLVPPAGVEDALKRYSQARFISNLNQVDYQSLPLPVISRMLEREIENLPHTIFLTHDKRFLSLMNDTGFLNRVFTEEEQATITKFHLPTYLYSAESDVWKEARENKDQWIIKHHRLGKGQQVFSGALTSAAEWDALFSSNPDDYILQSLMDQDRLKGTIGDEQRDDYYVLTFMMENSCYYGPGIIRASSHPVTNHGDNRKVLPVEFSK